MDAMLLQPQAWAAAQFGSAQLGDRRRSQRLVKLATQVAANPSDSFPDQTEVWGDLKAAYRLFDCAEVTFAAIASPHWQQTRGNSSGRCLILDDTTEIDFHPKRQIRGLGPVGNGHGQGFLLHSGLMVAADSDRLYGLAGQLIYYRKSVAKKETRTQRLKRDRESGIWGQLIEQIGSPPPGAVWIHVMDRGGDDFENLWRCQKHRVGWIARAKSLNRKVATPSGEESELQGYLAVLPVAGRYVLELRARPGQAARAAQLEVRLGPLLMPPPRLKSPALKAERPTAIPQWVVEVRETNPPADVEPIHWVLYTSESAQTLPEARDIVAAYEKRWLIEEWHKALKTGCQVQKRQLETAKRLEGVVGLMSVEAVRLLQLKAAARTAPDRPAEEFVPARYVAALRMVRKPKRNTAATEPWSVRRFYRELAGLGGFLGRKGDGEPGWITLWRGWEKLHWMLRGADCLARLQGRE